MKVYIIVYNDVEIAVDKVYTVRAQAEKDMQRLIDATDARAAEIQMEHYFHLYSIDELELVTTEEMTLEEVYDL